MCHCHGEHQNLLSLLASIHVDTERTELQLQCSQRRKSPWDLQEQHGVRVALLAQIQEVDLGPALMLQPRKTYNISWQTSTAKENLLNHEIRNTLKPPRKSTGRKLVTTESTNVIPAPAERSDSAKVYINNEVT